MTWFCVLIVLGVSLWDLPVRAAERIFPTDPRIVYANSLLDDESEWPTAIELYEEVLAEDPNHVVARQWLARVHPLQGEYEFAFADYEVLLTLPNPPEEARIERAEVLSWAGRYDEAETEFETILAEDSANERAARGLVLVYHWSGRAEEAEAAYQRAAAIWGAGDDGELSERDEHPRRTSAWRSSQPP